MAVDELLGPFAVSGDNMPARRPDGSSTGCDDRFRMLKDAMKAAGVNLAGWEWIVLRRLADQDVQTAAAVVGWVGRARMAGLAAGTAGRLMAVDTRLVNQPARRGA
jgi:hypothetical protein